MRACHEPPPPPSCCLFRLDDHHTHTHTHHHHYHHNRRQDDRRSAEGESGGRGRHHHRQGQRQGPSISSPSARVPYVDVIGPTEARARPSPISSHEGLSIHLNIHVRTCILSTHPGLQAGPVLHPLEGLRRHGAADAASGSLSFVCLYTGSRDDDAVGPQTR